MQRFRNLLAIALVALWLPATLHCQLEAAGVDELFACEVDHCKSDAEPPRDTCDVVESSWIKLNAPSVLLAAPSFCRCIRCFLLQPPELPMDALPGINEAVQAPAELTHSWHFLARTAPPARAPSAAS